MIPDTSTSQMSRYRGSTDLVRNEPGESQEKIIYMALRTHFSDHFSRLRKAKKIRTRINDCRNFMWVKLLLQKYGIDAVCATAKRLLAHDVFDSKMKADGYFVARGQKISLKDPEISARAQVEVLNGEYLNAETKIVQGDVESKSQTVMLSSLPKINGCTMETSQATEEKHGSPHIRYISQAEQHKALRKTQKIAEGVFFKYARIYMKEILSQKQWLCKEAVELHEWTRVLRGRQDRFDPGLLKTLPRDFEEILDSLTHLRHAAVHRHDIPLVRILSFIMDTESISKLCEDNVSFEKLTLLRRDLETSHM